MVSSYSLSHYGEMIQDKPRVEAFLEAIKRHAPGKTVLEIGTGPGFFALAACRFGANKVYALEPSPYIEVGRRCAKANGMDDRIEFIQDISTRFALTEKVDLLISDMRGILPFLDEHIPSVMDARSRLLKPDGVLLGQRDILWAMPVECPGQWSRHHQPWGEPFHDLGLDLSAGLAFSLNSSERFRCRTREHLLETPAKLGEVDYTTVQSPDFSGEVSWFASREATVHGFIVWFDCEVDEGVGFSNSPLEESIPNSYGQNFFPLKEPLTVHADEPIRLKFEARLTEASYLYQWAGSVGSKNFGQSSLFAQPDLQKRLQRQRKEFASSLGTQGKITLKVLSLIEVGETLEAIAAQLLKDFRFSNEDHALRVVQDIASHFGA